MDILLVTLSMSMLLLPVQVCIDTNYNTSRLPVLRILFITSNVAIVVYLLLPLQNSQVGHLPVIHPGETFCYTSGCELETEKGTMDGCFHVSSYTLYMLALSYESKLVLVVVIQVLTYNILFLHYYRHNNKNFRWLLLTQKLHSMLW